jgi:hypothetical protein
MSKFSDDELKKRAFERTAWVLKHCYDEQAEEFTGEARLHSRLFDTLIPDVYVFIGKSAAAVVATEQGKLPYREHVVPCAYIRNLSFKLYSEGKTVDDVASMVKRLLNIAFITPDEAKLIDKKHKATMPDDWSWMEDSVTRRLDDDRIKLIPRA